MPKQLEGETIRQKMASTRAEFVFGDTLLDFKISRKRDQEVGSRLPWSQIPPPSTYVRESEADVWLRWTLMVMPMLAAFALVRPGDPVVTISLYAVFALVATAALLATRAWRRVSYVLIRTNKINVVVLDDSRRDEILRRIEDGRRGAWSAEVEPQADETVRQRLRRLRWLSESEIVSRDERASTESGLPTARPASPADDVDFVQRALGRTMRFTFRPDQLIHVNEGWLGDRQEVRIPYQRLGSPETVFGVERNSLFGFVGIAWTVAIGLAWLSTLTAAHGPNHYVGGRGLSNAISDFWPIFTICGLLIWLSARRAEFRYGRPYSEVTILRDGRYDQIVEEIERRRLAALRALAEPDLSCTVAEQVETLDMLLDAGAVSQDEYAGLVRRAEIVCGDPDLDEPADQDIRRPAHAIH